MPQQAVAKKGKMCRSRGTFFRSLPTQDSWSHIRQSYAQATAIYDKLNGRNKVLKTPVGRREGAQGDLVVML